MTRRLEHLIMGPSEFVKSLGTSADEVADSLRRLGVKGRTTSGGSKCPVAVAINEYATGWGGIRVNAMGLLTYGDDQICDPQTTPAIREFVDAFDKGLYPDLIGGP